MCVWVRISHESENSFPCPVCALCVGQACFDSISCHLSRVLAATENIICETRGTGGSSGAACAQLGGSGCVAPPPAEGVLGADRLAHP